VSHEDEPTEEIELRQGGVKTRRRTRPASTPFLTAGSRLRGERYVLERVLGRGGMAAVWLARDERLERRVAVKILSDSFAGDEEYLRRFQREARVAASLSHPNLVQIYDFDASGPRPCLVMEYVAGGDLGERLRRGQRPSPEGLARDLLAALRQIHAAGVLHRDVKPQNVLIGRDGRARLTDFGIARPRDATSLTQTGQVLGTASYMAPEVLEGEEPTERSDLYSLGVVLDEVCGQTGPGGPALGGLAPRLRDRDPAERPESAEAALRELERPPAAVGPPTTAFAPQDAEGAVAEPPPDPSLIARRRWRDPRVVLAALAAALAAVLAIVLLGGGDDGGDPLRQAGANQGEANGNEERQRDPAEPAPATGAELDAQGKALIDQGRYEEAIPILRRAVASLADSGDRLTYGYALFNLAHALRLSGRPEEAIPLLEERLTIPDQIDVVEAELEAALEDAGLEEDNSGPGSGSQGKAKGQEKKEDD
jgi:serine/threonine protein kinase